MSYEDSKAHCQQLNSIHPWVGSAVEVTALQRMVKEGRYDVARAKQYTHERTKERLAKMHVSPRPSPMESPQPQHTLPEPARGCGMTRRADRYFIQETLHNMNLQDGPSCPGTPFRESHPATPEAGQYDSPDVDDPEEDLTSQANFNSEDKYTDATGCSGQSLSAERNCRRNHAMGRERAHVKHNIIEVVQCEGGSWLSLCSGSLTEMTVFHIVTGRQRWRLPWPKATSLNESKLLCSRPWRAWLKTMWPT